jgi:hypothetical protein
VHKNRVPVDGEGGLAQRTPVPSYGSLPLVVHPVSDIESEAVSNSTIRQGEGQPVVHSFHKEVPSWLYEKGEDVRKDTP